MTFYMEIVPVNGPLDMGTDDSGSALSVANFSILKRESGTLLEEVYGLLNGFALPSGQVLASSRGEVPRGTSLMIVETGGTAPRRTHDDASSYLSRPTVKIIARAENDEDARAAAAAAYDILKVVRNRDVPAVTIG